MSKLDYPLTFHPSLPLGEEMNVSEIPVDTGLIQCICESTEDDGFTIQCDRCLTWQHAYCMNINQNNIPDRYLCDNCVKRIPSATTHTLSNGGKDTQRSTSKFTSNSSTDSELENNNNNNNKPTSTKRKEEKLKSNGSGRSFSSKSNAHNKRSRELQSLGDYSSVGINVGNNSKDSNSIHTGKAATTVKKPKLSKRISVPKRSLQRNMMMMVDSEQDLMTKATTKLHSKKKDKYQATNINTVKSKFVYEVIKETRDRWRLSPKWNSQPWRASSMDDHTATITQQPSNKKPPCGPFTVMDTISLQQSSSTNITIQSLPKQQQQQQQHQQLHHPRSSSSYKLRKGAFADTQLHANTFLLEAHGEMVLKSEYKFDATNDYSLLGTACAHVLFYPTVDLCIDGRRLGNDTRHFRRSCHPNAELRTMIFSRQKKRPHLSTSSIATTTTYTGGNGDSDIGGDVDDDDGWQKDDSLIRLGIFTRVPIEQGEEITLGWNWQKGHISWRKNVEWYRSSSSEHEHYQNRTLAHVKSDPMMEETTTTATLSGGVDLIGSSGNNKNNNNNSSSILRDETGDDEESDRHTRYAIQQMLERFDSEFGDCACSEHDVCLIERLRQECDMLSSSPVLLNGRIEPAVAVTTTKLPVKPNPTSSSLQHSRQIIVAPSTASPGSKSDNEKMVTTGHSPAAGSVEENVEIDVISMSPGAAAAPSPANHNTTLTLDQVKKEANSDVDDELDIDGDIDIGDDDIPALSKTSVSSTLTVPVVTEENKSGGGGQLQPYGVSLSSTSSLSGTDSDSNGDATDRKKKGRRVFKKPKHDPGLDSTGISMTITPTNKPSALPRKKVWMQHFLQHNVKTENVTQESSDADKQKSPGIDDNGDRPDGEMDAANNQAPTSMNIQGNTDGNGGVDSAKDKTSTIITATTEDVVHMDLDDGELSDASSASTIPLDEDDRDWTLRTRERQPPSEQPSDQPSDPSATSTEKLVINDNEPPVDTTSSITTATPPPPVSAFQQETTPLEEKPSAPLSDEAKLASLSTKAPSSSTEEEAEQVQQQQPNETMNTDDGNDTGKEAQDGFDQAKPTKVKVSLQEYLSRRMASKEPPKPATAPNPHNQVN